MCVQYGQTYFLKKYNKPLSLEKKEPKFIKLIAWFHQALSRRGAMEGGTSSSCDIPRSSGPHNVLLSPLCPTEVPCVSLTLLSAC